MTAETGETSYQDDELKAIIERYPLLDFAGNEPYILNEYGLKSDNVDWSPTYDLNAAAADVWNEKAGAIADQFDFTAGGQSFSRSQAYKAFSERARYYASRRALSTIKLLPGPPVVEED